MPSGKVWGAIAILPAKRPQGRSCARTRVHTRARIHARPPGGTKAALWFGARLPGPGGWHWHGAGSLKGRPVCGQPARQGCQRGLAVGTQRRGTQGQRASTGHPPQRPRLQLEGPGRCAPLRLHGRAGTRGHTRAHACTHVGAGTRRRARAEALASTLARVCVYIYIYMQAHLHTRTCTPQSPPITLLASLGRVRPLPCLSFPIFPATTPSALGPSPPHSARSTHGSPRSSTPPSSTHPGGGEARRSQGQMEATPPEQHPFHGCRADSPPPTRSLSQQPDAAPGSRRKETPGDLGPDKAELRE